MKKCRKCGQLLDLSEFPLDKQNLDGHKGMCRKCTREYNRNYNKKQKEKYLKIHSLITSEDKAKYILGGLKCYILNHIKKGEFKYNIICMEDGKLYQTNSLENFVHYLKEGE